MALRQAGLKKHLFIAEAEEGMHSNTADESSAPGAPLLRCAETSWLLLGLLLFCFLCAFFHVSDVDVGYHIRTGEHILSGKGIPSQNTFSYSVPNETWFIQQWMPATIYAWVHRLGGIPALTTFKTLLAVIAMYLVWCCARDVAGKRSVWPLWVCTIAVLIMRVRFYERPDLFTTTLFALLLFLDQRFGSRCIWQLIYVPLLMAFWANTHGGYVYGFVLLSALTAAEWLDWFVARIRKTDDVKPDFRSLFVRPMGMVLSVAIALASVQIINPSGWKTLLVPFQQFFSKLWQSSVMEFQPPTWADSKLLFLWIGALIVLQIITRKDFQMRYCVTSAALAYFACSSQRSLPAFIIASAPHAAFMLDRLPDPNAAALRQFGRLSLPVAWAALIAFVIMPDKTYLFGIGLYHPYYPTEIFRFVQREVPPQNIFNDMRFGGPMLWTLYPDFKPFIDGRNDAYTEDFWMTEYIPAAEGTERWPEIFAKYHVTAALLSVPTPTKVPLLARKLFEHPDWALVAFNDETLLFLKRTGANAALIDRHAFHHLWPGNWDLGQITATNLQAMAAEAARAFELYPGNYAHAVAARCAMAAGDFQGASELLGFLTMQGGAGEAFWRDYAFCLYQAQRYKEAERATGQMLKKHFAVGFAYYLRHFIALHDQKPGEAKELLEKALTTEPDNRAFRDAWHRFQQASTGDSRARS